MTSPLPFPMGDSRADFSDIIIDSAVAYYNGGVPISITRNSLTFEPNETWESYDFPGKTMPVVGLDEVVSARPVVKGTMMMAGEAQFLIYRPGGAWSDATTAGGIITTGARQYTPGAFRAPLSVGVYLPNFLVVWKKLDNSFIGVQFAYALCTKYSLEAKDGDEGLFAVEFEARQANTATPRTSPPYTVITIPDSFDVPSEGDSSGDVPPEGGPLGNMLWDLNADTLALTLSDDDSVDTWADDVGSNDATAGDTSPVFKADGLGTGKPSVRFTSGGADSISYSVPASSTQTRYLVVKFTTGAGTGGRSFDVGTVFSGHGLSNIKDIGLGLGADGKLRYSIGENAVATSYRSTTTPSSVTGAIALVALTYDAVSERGKIFVDDMTNEAATDIYPLDPGLFDDYPTEFMGVGGSAESASIGMDVGRHFVYDTAHNATQRAQVKATLATRWGLP